MLSLIDCNGKPLKKRYENKIVNESGQEVNSRPMTTEEIGYQLASHLLNTATVKKNNEDVNKQFDVLYHAALHILSHRVVNVGLGFGEDVGAVCEWDASRAFAQEKDVQENLTKTIEQWKTMFFNGELTFNKV